MQSPNIKEAKSMNDYQLLITFMNGEIKKFDLKPYLKYTVFKPLVNNQEFHNFSIVDGTIEWECGADLSPDTFYLESVHYNMETTLKEM
jgi:hypothetical protein